ncbi:MAG: GntR family transcriptional regulator [Thermomicrobiales bacterium]
MVGVRGQAMSLMSEPNRVIPDSDFLGDGIQSPGAETRVDFVARHLRSSILDGRLKPGDWVRQEAVAAALGTSRIPVREALRQLESEGFVSLVPFSGARVAKVDVEEHEEIYLMREWLEPLAIRESLPHLTGQHLRELRDLVGRIEASRETSDVLDLDLDRRFHLLSYSAAPRPRLLKMIESFWNTTQQYRRVYYRTVADDRERLPDGFLPMTHLDHHMLIDAIERRDADTAESVVRAHIRRTRLTLTSHREVFDE